MAWGYRKIAEAAYKKSKKEWVIAEMMKCLRDIEEAEKRIEELEKGKIEFSSLDLSYKIQIMEKKNETRALSKKKI